MDNFKENIKAQLEEEVTPIFHEESWSQFQKFCSAKEKKNRFIWLFFVGIGLLAFSIILFLGRPNGDIQKDQFADSSKDYYSNQGAYIAEDFKEPLVENSLDEYANKIRTNPIQYTKDIKHNSQKILGTNNLQVKSDAKLFKRYNQGAQSTNNGFNIGSKKFFPTSLEEIRKIGLTEDQINEDQVEFILRSRENNISLIKNIPMVEITINRSEEQKYLAIPYKEPTQLIDLKSLKSKFEIDLYAGLSYPFHIETFEEQAYHFGLNFKYRISHKLQFKTKVRFQQLSFLSEIAENSLGVRFIDAPKAFQKLTKVEVESTNLNFGVGLDFQILSKNNWSIFAGPSYMFSKEILKEVDYYFEGPNLNEDEDDEIVHLSNKDLYFEKGLIDLEMSAIKSFSFGGNLFRN